MSDRGYVNLIRHLTRTTSTLPLETIQASIAHYLARPPVPIPGSPTALTATVLGSPLFRPYTYVKLTALAVAFRHAVHLRVAVHRTEAEQSPGSILPPSRGVNVTARLAKWVRATLEGFAGSAAVIRLACASGMLLGLQDWEAELKITEKEARAKAKVEEEVVLALAEVVDTYAREGSGWEMDFKRSLAAKGVEEDPLALAVLLASQCAQFVAPQRLQALPLPTVVDILLSTIERSYHSGTFLSQTSTGVRRDVEGKLTILSKSAFAQAVRSISSSTYIASMASLARFTALSLTVLVESRRVPGWEAIGRTLARLQLLTGTVEKDWLQCPLAGVNEDSELADDNTREIATATWQVLKTLLFTTLMVLQSILSTVVFVPGPQWTASSSASPLTPSPYAIALDALHTLSRLSFVMPQFGGVASTSEGGLPELKRAFYMALDVLSASEAEAGRFVKELCQHKTMSEKGKAVETLPRVLLDAKKAFALACVEQLVPVLPEAVIQSHVYPLCYPHLWDASHRETYESAHSAMLAIFVSHAKNSDVQRLSEPAFTERILPMYAHCLVENSFDGRLSTTQLCMAYAALVRSASSFGYASAAQGSSTNVDADSMAWFCIEVLLDAIRHARAAPVKATLPYSPDAQSSSSSPPAPVTEQESFDIPSEHLHRLQLALIATVPSVSLTLLPRLLAEVKAIVVSVSLPSLTHDASARRIEEMRAELVEAIFRAVSHDVGDSEKDYAIEWWYENREELVLSKAAARHPVFDGVEASAQSHAPDIVSRL